jgi:hypothetical protein
MRRNTKVKEFLSCKSKRKYIPLNYKHETTSVTGVPINKNGKPIIRYKVKQITNKKKLIGYYLYYVNYLKLINNIFKS